MAAYNYSYQGTEKESAKAVVVDGNISTKKAIEICSKIRYKKIEKAKEILEKAIKLEKPIRFTRFTDGAGHKTRIGPGKYPVKAAQLILKAVKSAESNANDKGLTENLKITHLIAQKGSNQWRYGRQRRRRAKRTHIEVILTEMKSKRTQQKEAKVEIKETKLVKEEATKLTKTNDTKSEETHKSEASGVTESKDSGTQKQNVSVVSKDKSLSSKTSEVKKE